MYWPVEPDFGWLKVLRMEEKRRAPVAERYLNLHARRALVDVEVRLVYQAAASTATGPVDVRCHARRSNPGEYNGGHLLCCR